MALFGPLCGCALSSRRPLSVQFDSNKNGASNMRQHSGQCRVEPRVIIIIIKI